MQGAALRLTTDDGEALAIGVLPTTRWEDIVPARSYLDELASNAAIRQVCPHIAQVASDIRAKAEELPYIDEAEGLVAAINSEDWLSSIVAYTHDLQQPNGVKAGNYYFEMNRMLRDRSPAGRAELMMTWGVCVHYTLKALAKLDDFHGIVYRGFPASDKVGILHIPSPRTHLHIPSARNTTCNLVRSLLTWHCCFGQENILQRYKKGRPIQWGAFTSTTTSLEAASGFAGAGGVIIKISLRLTCSPAVTSARSPSLRLRMRSCSRPTTSLR